MDKKIINLKEMLASAPQEERKSIIQNTISLFILKILGSSEEIDRDSAFHDLGLDSVSAVKLKQLITDSLNGTIQIKSTDIFDYPSINKLSDYIEEKLNL